MNDPVSETGGDGERASTVGKPVSFADYAGAWREGKGLTWEEINAEIREFRGHEDDVRNG